MEEQRVDWRLLEAGYEFPPAEYRIDATGVAVFLEAVDGDAGLYRGPGLVPPMALAAHCLAALSEAVSFPEGAVHVSQVVEFTDTAAVGDTITGYARVGRSQKRGRLHLLSIDLCACREDGRVVLRGRTDFILPQSEEGAGNQGDGGGNAA